jgi:hypothetical protein
MKGKINGVMYSQIKNATLVEIEIDGNRRDEVNGLKEKPVEIILKKYRQKRSLDANSYYWVLVGKLAYKVGIKRSEIYRSHIKDMGGNFTVVCVQEKAADTFCRIWESQGLGWVTVEMPSKIAGCVNIMAYYGSSVYDKEQMSKLINLAVQDCEAVGIETLTPKEIEKMISAWENG